MTLTESFVPSEVARAPSPAATAARAMRLSFAWTTDFAAADVATLDLSMPTDPRAAAASMLSLMRTWHGPEYRFLAELDEAEGGALYRLVKAARADLAARGAEALPGANALVAGLSAVLLDPAPAASLRAARTSLGRRLDA